ncbi:BN860_11012g1_1 [Zygosaccharomyces bailii CLIB 213]|uniref:BN860_11012g1_1 n=1 Tax=Zygosaccharomyces bailii (strain CLIB 213 / ATCC 58445 / CBS 680 / BCRC 21525 / NBRC 1098 / NCYC 1416 / NRRL Y-2227) TaxID=1333698 RepID=A0A8J2X574_ZYGB2|nr:BN860_11012g1_1 [Zygosaccharomyces bailii CLIB 213]
MNDDDLELHEEEFLMTTRKRRSNAGNKMRKLLEQELEDMHSRTENLEQDEVDLLFQEDAEDEEFEAGDESDTELTEKSNDVERKGEVDEMFSESEEESEDQNEDDEEGEKVLQRQEKLESRKRKKKQTPAVIKRKRVNPETDAAKEEQKSKKKAHYEQIKAENLLISNRRTSQRSSVVANKMKVYEKLSKAEKKRKVIQDRIRKHREAQKEEILTQEDRIRIALETEKFNILSLDKYKEQEVSKKQSRIALQQRQKLKFIPGETVIRQLSCSWAVTPAMELEDLKYWEEQVKRREKKKKKYTRRSYKKHNQDSKNEVQESKVKEEPCISVPTIEQSPSKASADFRETKEEFSSKVPTREKSPNYSESHIDIKETPEFTPSAVSDNSLRSKTESDAKIGESDTTPLTGNNNEIKASSHPENFKTQSLLVTNRNEEIVAGNKHAERLLPPVEIEAEDVHQNPKTENEEEKLSGKHSVIPDNEYKNTSESTRDNSPAIFLPEEQTSSPQLSNNKTEALENQSLISSLIVSKQVTFAEEPQVTLINSSTGLYGDSPSTVSTTTKKYEREAPDLVDDFGSEEETVFQGPEQLVAKNFVTLYSFPNETYHRDVRKELFGVNWESGLSHRSSDVETICKLTMPEEKDDFDTASLTPNLSFLNKFPAFGEYDKKVVHDTDASVNKEFEIEIKTSPPTGVYLPNGLRKKCLISSKECQYFDPKNGVPYSDVETYKIIQELQNPIGKGTEEEPKPRFQWFGFSNGGIYLDISEKPANGVPDGF